jgi:hypothetical protein
MYMLITCATREGGSGYPDWSYPPTRVSPEQDRREVGGGGEREGERSLLDIASACEDGRQRRNLLHFQRF